MSCLLAGMDWRELESLLKEERRAGNPMAALVAGLQVGGCGARRQGTAVVFFAKKYQIECTGISCM